MENKQNIEQKKFLYKQSKQAKMFYSTQHKLIHKQNQQTGTEFYDSLDDKHQQSFTYEIEMQKQYVQRLKMQRQKIQSLYQKYDTILNEMKKKDLTIQDKNQRIKNLDAKIKEMELHLNDFSIVKEQNREITNENMFLKKRIAKLENQNQQLIQQMKLKQYLVTDEKDQLDQRNCQLINKINHLNNKLAICQQQLKSSLKIEKEKFEISKNQCSNQTLKLTSQLNQLRDQLIKRDETIHMIKLDHEFMSQKLRDQQENYSVYLKDLQIKIQKSQKDKKNQIKSLKNVIEDKSNQINTLLSKSLSLKQQLQLKQTELQEARTLIMQQKRLFDEDLFKMKSQMNNEKNYYKQQFMHCQNHIGKIQTKLNQNLRRQKQLTNLIRKYESSEIAKRNLRQIQKQQLQKINRILCLQ